MSVHELYKQKKAATSLEAVSIIQPREDIIVPLAVGEPPGLVLALAEHNGLEGNRLFQMLSLYPVLSVDPSKVKIVSMFLNKDERRAFYDKEVDLLPNHFSDLPQILKETTHDRVIMAAVSPMDEDGYFSLGTNCDYVAPLLKDAKRIILEVNENMPRTFGQNHIHIDQVDAFIENHVELPVTPDIPLRPEDEIIGKTVADLIQNGDTLQIGFGAIPNAIMNFLKDHRDLTIFTEMIPDKVVDLFESGAVSNLSNPLHKGSMTATFAFGTKRLYDFMDQNKQVQMYPVDETNDSCLIAKINQLVTINATIEVDLIGQCNSESIGGRYYSSTGGQGDFGIGARMSKGGKGIICLHSTTKGGTISKIVPTLATGSVVTTSKNDVDYIVTEYGVAKLRGKTIRERTQALIDIAHPNFRDELTEKAKDMGYL
ncbi:4-hydroxybutyrate CoA-transferase [Alkalihalophilus pseudofirmus]|uniref:Acetyl-CoA hydrolase/transferase C-terminal domain-containing protein n=1 Tax=Alkalihalophilus pseudofirmus TaxID=79885 RepID=A0AAJ2U2W8_ALKPS|nr:acetyl-CoA hydrolase/transferase C-terminal domain-containing protein [Alkalihalophilus pseudofirmus]MDV2885662.1 acetyl-CoA hydrolase/transferase C-terminal domain-containing protein [Alkalihalophilus pseudofirmus]OLS39509.1 4-hydroxybutyrate CoA-transferase [Alkalihalophilus pseudofirmus]